MRLCGHRPSAVIHSLTTASCWRHMFPNDLGMAREKLKRTDGAGEVRVHSRCNDSQRSNRTARRHRAKASKCALRRAFRLFDCHRLRHPYHSSLPPRDAADSPNPVIGPITEQEIVRRWPLSRPTSRHTITAIRRPSCQPGSGISPPFTARPATTAAAD